MAYPLPSSDPWQHAALVVFVREDFSADEELVLSSLASLIPVAFERALGTEAALAHEARLRAVVEASPVALIGLEGDGTVTMANRAALQLFGWADGPSEWVLEGPLREPLAGMMEAVLLSGSVVNRACTIDSRDISLSGAPMPALTLSDHPTVLVAGVDVSEVRRAERALVQAQRLEAMGQVAGRVAHDFNNLLTLIIGYSEILRRGTDDPRQHTLVGNIEEASRRAAKLTQQMLDMTRQKVDSGVVIDFGREVTGLDAVLAKVAGPRVDLRIRSSQNVIKVRLDPSEMEQIVLNLVINACDAMDGAGKVEVGVSMAAPPNEERVEYELPAGPLALLTISDDGPGMPEDVLSRCLEPFFTTKERGQGSGLGLPTVYGLVKERGGQLRIDSSRRQRHRHQHLAPHRTRRPAQLQRHQHRDVAHGQNHHRDGPAGRGRRRAAPDGRGRPRRHRARRHLGRIRRARTADPEQPCRVRRLGDRHHAAGDLRAWSWWTRPGRRNPTCRCCT